MMTRLLALACVLLFNQAALAWDAGDPFLRSDLDATRAHYARLIAEPQALAELTLFTTLLPKGGDLHHHYSGAMYAETYLDWVEKKQYCIHAGSAEKTGGKRFHIETKPAALSANERATCLSIKELRADNNLYRELLSRWSNKDYDKHYHQQPAPDQQFFDTFNYFREIDSYDLKAGLHLLKARAQAENLGYLETMLKSAPAVDLPELAALFGKLDGNSPPAEIQAVLAQAYERLANDRELGKRIDVYLDTLQQTVAGIDDATFRLRLHSYVVRGNPPQKVFAGLYSAFQAAERSPLVVGVNIVGPENGHLAMRDYALHMHMFAFLKARHPQVKLALHAGELVLGMVPPEGLRHHIRDAVLLAGAQRIGHGVDIAHEDDAPALLQAMKARNVAVEINLTSNAFILGVKDDAHPLRLYARHGVPLVISTDDPGVSRNNLSGEYLLYASRYRPTYDQLKNTVYNSIRHAFLSEAEKREELARLDARFAAFEAKIARLAEALGD